MALLVNEIFSSVAGEGKHIGMPTTFIRLQGCNMAPRCSWCDSSYAVDGERGQKYSVEQIIQKVQKLGLQDITITGGEPMRQKEDMFQIIGNLPTYNRFHLETNGTLYDERMRFFYNISCSPKKQAQDESVRTCHQIAQLEQATFKFVYEDKNDKWWEKFIEKTRIDKDKVWIMPEGKNREEQILRSPEVIKYCLNNRFKFSPRLHVLIWGNKRGV